MYLKWGCTCMLTLYQPGSPSTSVTVMLAFLKGRRERTPGEGLSWSATYWRIQLLSSVSRSHLSFQVPMFSRWMTLM